MAPIAFFKTAPLLKFAFGSFLLILLSLPHGQIHATKSHYSFSRMGVSSHGAFVANKSDENFHIRKRPQRLPIFSRRHEVTNPRNTSMFSRINFYFPRSLRIYSSKSHDTNPTTTTTSQTVKAYLNPTQKQNMHDRPTAQTLVSQILCPPTEERDRSTAGMEAYYGTGGTDPSSTSFDTKSQAITNDDPRSEFTYGEFPFGSFDLLVDRALELRRERREIDERGKMWEGRKMDEGGNFEKNPIMIDLGSGCGRLVLYAALTRGGTLGDSDSTNDPHLGQWDVHGIEIGTQLHSLAVNSLERGVANGCFCFSSPEDEGMEQMEPTSSQIAFHNGNALLVEVPFFSHTKSSAEESTNHETCEQTIQSLLSNSSLLFAYSTVWETDSSQPFDPDLQAMILSPKWSKTLADKCCSGCVAITTDRALNPGDGWRLLDRMEVDNPSVWGSVGYISVLEK